MLINEDCDDKMDNPGKILSFGSLKTGYFSILKPQFSRWPEAFAILFKKAIQNSILADKKIEILRDFYYITVSLLQQCKRDNRKDYSK